MTSISLTETGQFIGDSGNVLVWTGMGTNVTSDRTLSFGQIAGCDNWLNDKNYTGGLDAPFKYNAIFGDLTRYWSWEWTNYAPFRLSCDQTAHLYCFEQ